MKNVAIIGAGASGLTAIKCCLEEGLVPTCYERTSDIGGLWNYTEEVTDEQACVMKSTVINTSKEMMCYSDFPIPQEFPVYMHNKYVQQYFEMYSEKFKLKKHIKFNTEILSVKPADNFDDNGQWLLTVKDKKTGKTDVLTFDAVLVCTGHHASKHQPDFPGLSEFKGKVIHTHDYRAPGQYEDKRVVVIGIGNSGGDVAVELGGISSQVFLSTRRGSWVLPRIGPNGVPMDFTTTRLLIGMRYLLPTSILEAVAQYTLNRRFDHAAYSLQPDHPVFGQHPMVNDNLPNRIASGSIVVKPNVRRFTANGVEFEDGTKEENIDAVILATGYIFGFPFIDKSIIDVKQNRIELYKYMFPPNLKKQTLSVIGCVQPIGAIMPISELQCRLATRVFKGDVTLPTKDEMWSDIRNKEDAMRRTYVQTQRHTIQVDWIPFMDELATLNNCKPDLGKMMLSDLRLAMTCLFGPCTPYQYRLEGPGRHPGARDLILTQMDRTMHALRTRPLGFDPKSGWSISRVLKLLIFIVILLAVIFKYFI